MAAPLGNKNGAKSRVFEQTLRRAILQDDGVRVRAAAEKVLTLASEGERWAVECLRDTLDGKPAQSVAIDITNRTVVDLADAELAAFIAEDSGSGVTSAQDGSQEPAGLH